MNDQEREHKPSITQFLAAASWKHALFTTYALSLSYFESEVLRPLLQSGCDDIWLITDAEGYKASLLERRSMRVGQEYRLIPAALPNGLLHAKSIYLCNEDEDLLLVGSGNLTFGGHGKNAEVFEALVPAGSASAFEDFVTFLESFGSRRDIRLGRREWIDDFAARARRAAARGRTDEPAIRLLHSLDTPIVTQLREGLGTIGQCERAIIMSPYYDPDGKAVETLLNSIDAKRAAVSVWLGKTTPFPFAKAASWDRPVEAVTAAEPESRFVHAKWYEFEFASGRMLLTGSINGTSKALMTTDNIELGVLRSMPLMPPPIQWKKADEPAFEPLLRLGWGFAVPEIIYAGFDRANAQQLHGQLISGKEVSGEWQMRLVQADGEFFSGVAILDAQGHFSISDPALEPLSSFAAVQILLIRGDREARGWVHNEMLLSVGTRRRLTAGALSRLMRREGSDDDIQALLDYLSINAEQHLRLFDQPIRDWKRPAGGNGQEPIITVHIDELEPLALTPTTEDHNRGAGSRLDDQFEAAMLRLRRVLLGHGRVRSQPLENRSDSTLAEEDLAQGRKRTPEEERKALGLDDFEAAITQLIDDARGLPEIVDRLLVLLVEVSMWMRLSRLGDVDGAHDFLSGWFFKASRLGHYDPTRITALQQHVTTAAATLYTLVPDPQARQSVGTSLHDGLEKFFRSAVDVTLALSRLFPDPQAGFSALLLGETEGIDLPTALRDLLAIRTRRLQLDDALRLAARGNRVPREWEIFSSDIGQALWEALETPDWQKKVRRGSAGTTACAFDYFKFSLDESRQYLRLRFTRCIHCKRFTVDTAP